MGFRTMDAWPSFTSRTLSLYLFMGPSHVLVPAWGPMKNPRSLARGATLNSAHSGTLFLSHLIIASCILRENMQSGTRTHFIGFNSRPANVLHSLNTGAIRFRCFSQGCCSAATFYMARMTMQCQAATNFSSVS